MYTVNVSKRQLTWGLLIFILTITIILSALIVKNARAQGLDEYLLAVGFPVCVIGNADLNPAGKTRGIELGQMRVPFIYSGEGELHLDLGPCNENEFPIVLAWNCVGDLGGDFVTDLFCKEPPPTQ